MFPNVVSQDKLNHKNHLSTSNKADMIAVVTGDD